MAGISLYRNFDSLFAQKELGQSTSALATSYERLSSGLRINQASDDVAGLAIATQLNSQSRVFTQAVRNINDGIGVASTAESALTALQQISQRQLELAEQASNGTLSLTQRQALNTEANALVDEFNRIVSTTTFNGMNLLDPSLGSVLIQGGYGKAAQIQLQLNNQLQHGVGNGTFGAARTLATGGGFTTGVALGDLTGNGLEDIVSASYDSYSVSVQMSNGNGTFKAAQVLSTGAGFQPDSVELADINGDGELDIVMSNYLSGSVGIFLGNGDGTFKALQTFQTTSTGTTSTAIGDVNGDGKEDIVATDTSGVVSVFLGNGNGTFQAAQAFSEHSIQSSSVSLEDLNGDGKLDIVTGSPYANSVSVLLGNGNGTFGAAQTYLTGGGDVFSAAVGDLTGNGIEDIVTADFNTDEFSILVGNGNGTFKAAETFQTGTGSPYTIALGDINGDGILDVVTAGYNGGIGVSLGNGDGTFGAIISSNSNGIRSTSIGLGDLNGDGKEDIVAASYLNSVSVLLANGSETSSTPYLDLNTQRDAAAAVNTITATLSRVQNQLGAVGATSSVFQVAMENAQSMSDDFQAAAARIEDVDVAQETATMLREQILQQITTAILAQANLEPENVLTLLGVQNDQGVKQNGAK